MIPSLSTHHQLQKNITFLKYFHLPIHVKEEFRCFDELRASFHLQKLQIQKDSNIVLILIYNEMSGVGIHLPGTQLAVQLLLWKAPSSSVEQGSPPYCGAGSVQVLYRYLTLGTPQSRQSLPAIPPRPGTIHCKRTHYLSS